VRLAQAEAFFRKRGDTALLIGRLISGVRALISYPAGLFEMPYLRFVLFTAIGALLWPLLAAGAGYLVGPNWPVLITWLERAWFVIVAAILLALGGWIYWRRRGKTSGT
jgi:membrane protein DedA with SNARE-associated domain